MLDQTLLEVLKHPADGALAIVTQGVDEPHIANTWNSYVRVTADWRLLIPVGGMAATEENVARTGQVLLSIASREVPGKRYLGTGFLVRGKAKFLDSGPDFTSTKEQFTWARAVLEVTAEKVTQTL